MSKKKTSHAILEEWRELMSGQGEVDPRHPDFQKMREDIKLEVQIMTLIELERLSLAVQRISYHKTGLV